MSTMSELSGYMGLPPCGGSGLKYAVGYAANFQYSSPSMRREWIEMFTMLYILRDYASPSMRREWIEMSR